MLIENVEYLKFKEFTDLQQNKKEFLNALKREKYREARLAGLTPIQASNKRTYKPKDEALSEKAWLARINEATRYWKDYRIWLCCIVWFRYFGEGGALYDIISKGSNPEFRNLDHDRKAVLLERVGFKKKYVLRGDDEEKSSELQNSRLPCL